MLKMQYSIWNEREFPGFQDFMQKLYQECEPSPEMDTLFKDLEDYYAYLLSFLNLVNGDNYETILERIKLIERLNILPLTEQNHNVYGLSFRNQIFLCPSREGIHGLTKDEFRRIIFAHEIGHHITHSWFEDSKAFAKELYEDPRVSGILKNMGLDGERFIRLGFAMIDETVVQEVAERFMYQREGKKRPQVSVHNDKPVFDLEPYSSNYVFYGEFQEMVTTFARKLPCLRIPEGASDEEVLTRLVRLSFSKHFIKRVQRDIMMSGQSDMFAILLACMGCIRDADNQIMGLIKPMDKSVASYRHAFEMTEKNITDAVLPKNPEKRK